jgi:hypothetical protein
MTTLNLNAVQLDNSNLGIAFANLVYDLNNAAQKPIPTPSVIQVGQSLPSGVTDLNRWSQIRLIFGGKK